MTDAASDAAFSFASICKATPTSASAKDGASFIPSPTLNTKGEYDLAIFDCVNIAFYIKSFRNALDGLYLCLINDMIKAISNLNAVHHSNTMTLSLQT